MDQLRIQNTAARKCIVSVLTALWVFTPGIALAEDPPLLPTVEVETTQADLSYTRTVITRDDTEGMHFTNMNDALFMGTPGVSTSRRSETGFGGPNSGFLIRGLQGPHVPVFVDGIPIQVNNHFHARVDRYSSDMIDRMEITRGASVLKHGASAVAGAIDIYTRTPGKGFSGFAQAAWGRYDTTEVFGDVGYGWDSGSVLFSMSDRLTDGPPVNYGSSAGIPTAEAHDLTNYNFKATQNLNDTWSVGLRYSNAQEIPEDFPFAAGVTFRRFAQDETDWVLHLDRKTATSNSLIAVHDNELDNHSIMVTNGIEDPSTKSARLETETGILGRHTWLHSGGNSTTVGFHSVKYDDDRFESNAKKSEAKHWSAYVQVDRALTDNIRIDGGVRITKGEDFSTNTSPEVGLVYKVDPSLALRTRTGQAFRVPRIGETDASFSSTIENEEFDHFELGLNKTFSNGAEFDIAAWWMKGDNLIVRLGGGGAGAFYDNSGDFSHHGVEVSLRYPINEHFFMSAGYTNMSLEVETAAPQDTLDLALQYRQGKWRAELGIRNARNNAKPALENEDYTVADAHIQYSVSKNIDLFLDVDNITDTSYATFNGFGSTAENIQRMTMIGFRWKHR